jgi:hypothetical protein
MECKIHSTVQHASNQPINQSTNQPINQSIALQIAGVATLEASARQTASKAI